MKKIWFRHCDSLASTYRENLYFDKAKRDAFFAANPELVDPPVVDHPLPIVRPPPLSVVGPPPLSVVDSFDVDLGVLEAMGPKDATVALKDMNKHKWFDRLCLSCLPKTSKLAYDYERLDFAIELASKETKDPFLSKKFLKKLECRRHVNGAKSSEQYSILCQYNAQFKPQEDVRVSISTDLVEEEEDEDEEADEEDLKFINDDVELSESEDELDRLEASVIKKRKVIIEDEDE